MRTKSVAEAVTLIVVLQAARELLEYAASFFIPDSRFASRMTTMTVMIFLCAVFILYIKYRKGTFSVFPIHFGKIYIIATVVTALLFITAPSNYTDGLGAVMLLFYGSVVTPVYEELIFRGYIWNKTFSAFGSEIFTYIFSVLYFIVWHLGYMLPQFIDGNVSAVMWKLAAGFCYGIVLGFVRLKTKNCYATIIVHGILNLFMI